MYGDMMDDFSRFLERYRNAWNNADAEGVLSMYAPDVRIRWAQPGNAVRDEDYSDAAESWREAVKRYSGRDPQWHFEDIMSAPISESEALAAFWVSFEIEGRPAVTRAFFVEAFKKDSEGWKKIRSHVEYGLPVI